MRRQIKPPQKYVYANLVAYIISVIRALKPCTYHEAITSRESI